MIINDIFLSNQKIKMKIFIQIKNTSTIELNVKEDSTVLELKKMIEKLEKIPVENQILLKKNSNGYIYKQKIKENNILDEETLILKENDLSGLEVYEEELLCK